MLDEEATAAFNDSVSAEHAVVGGSLRTFVPGARFDDAAEIFRTVALGDDFPTFLTLGAYADYLTDED